MRNMHIENNVSSGVPNFGAMGPRTIRITGFIALFFCKNDENRNDTVNGTRYRMVITVFFLN